MTIETLLKQAYGRLSGLSETAQLDAQLLLAHTLGVSTTYFFTWPEKEVCEASRQAFEDLLKRREKGEPIAYILGEQDFWSLSLETSPSTLIPRADTERLVEVALEQLPSGASRIVDLGTGTGAIALALAKEWPASQVIGVDYQVEAVQLAERNAQRNSISNAEFRQSDWFSALIDEAPFDLIVSNPPYIDPEDEHLSQGDVRFEPLTALIAEDHGLADIRHIIKQAVFYLSPLGWLMFEHGYDQGESVRKLFNEHGFVEVATHQDLGGNDRVTIGRLAEQGVTEHSRGG
ncbi:MAG: peptide chain release factor N(5)-glutamine methyltransferase [Marinomonas sp.]|uniref:Release factor glutamine methyltransferase n=1 Tax=Marinomonas communis TaxID=28254 RepID=A0A4R6XCR6_9GAMM|nr:peptide chain release factor N(5)-glutamine methyltransferase [Marinomonas communis]RUM51637.1 MAG: peptide chain release factor N(5)-glutamine methyltransferase [Marinomonas sp.]RUM52841.1 MAG: peptide chain release factor N(5)-glutamine methyltransferase [Marinomonas sp.]TDR13408.1 [protein release factor]-glutamine N5-methyltransferase [Marinomonas communis]